MTSSATRARTPEAPAAAPARRGVVPAPERQRLAGTLGMVLRVERVCLGWTQHELARRAGLSRCTVERLETGRQRPSEASIWWLAVAMRGGLDVPGTLALSERLRRAAGASLRDSPRARVRRARLAEKHGLDLDGTPLPVHERDGFGAFAVALVATDV